MGKEQLLTDLLVRQAGRSQLGDLVLLPGQHSVGDVPAAAGGAKLRCRASSPGLGSELLEGAVCRGQLGPGGGCGVGAAELLAVGEPDPGRVEGPLLDARQAERGLEERGRAIVADGEGRASADELAYFVTVAEELHFGRAADRLGIAQPPLSRAISRLERRLGVRLFDRTSRRVSLTPAGQAFLDASRGVLAAADTAVRTAQRAARFDRLVVAARPGQGSGLLAAVLPRYERSKDALPVEILFTRQQAAALRDGTADAGLMCSTEDLTGLQTAELINEAPVALLPAAHLLASHPAVTIGELRHLDTFAEQCPDSSLDQIIDLVALGRLIVVVSDSTTSKLGPEVTAVPVTGVPASLLVLGWTPAIPRPALAAFISQAKRVTGSLVSHPKAS